MRPSRLAGLPSFCSSFQLTPVSTPSSRPVLASSTANAGDVQRLAQTHGLAGDDGPASILRNKELVLVAVGEGRVSRHTPVVYRTLHLLVEAVRQPLEEEDGEDVVLVVCRVDLPAQYVSGPATACSAVPGLVSGMMSPSNIPFGPQGILHNCVAENFPPQPGYPQFRIIRRLRRFNKSGDQA